MTTRLKSQTPEAKARRSARNTYVSHLAPQVPSEAETLERRRKVAELHVTGASTRKMADVLGVSWHTVAADIRVLFDLPQDERRVLVAAQVERYGAVMSSYWLAMRKGDPKAGPIVLRAMSDFNKLLGLDAPTRLEVTQAPTAADLEAKLAAYLQGVKDTEQANTTAAKADAKPAPKAKPTPKQS